MILTYIGQSARSFFVKITLTYIVESLMLFYCQKVKLLLPEIDLL